MTHAIGVAFKFLLFGLVIKLLLLAGLVFWFYRPQKQTAAR
jgi:cbb3-type cytochrome oxidase subunit 3